MTARDANDSTLAARKALTTLGRLVGVGAIAIALISVALGFQADFARAVTAGAVALLVALAALIVGGLLGFLFGIPRAMVGSDADADAGVTTGRIQRYRANTNLEQMSDWLTKILVGVGLTQLGQIPGRVRRIVEFVAPGMGPEPVSSVLALAILVYFGGVGFLFGYLWTRLELPRALNQAEIAAEALTTARESLTRVNEVAAEAARAERADVTALTTVERQLTGGTTPVDQATLDKAIQEASPLARVQVFLRAHEQRARTWDRDKASMARTIPVFRALIAADTREEFHRNWGDLGFALKDKEPPDWADAEAALTKAIAIRDRVRDPGWLFYEFNRAVCRIRLDPAFASGGASDPETRERIAADMRTAAQSPRLRGYFDSQEPFAAWTRLNEVTLDAVEAIPEGQLET